MAGLWRVDFRAGAVRWRRRRRHLQWRWMLTSHQYPNLVRQFAVQGNTWKGYFQSMPLYRISGLSIGSLRSPAQSFRFLYRCGVQPIRSRATCIPPIPTCCRTLRTINLANFTWISPDLDHDAHNGADDQQALAAADAYLQTFVPTAFVFSALSAGRRRRTAGHLRRRRVKLATISAAAIPIRTTAAGTSGMF